MSLNPRLIYQKLIADLTRVRGGDSIGARQEIRWLIDHLQSLPQSTAPVTNRLSPSSPLSSLTPSAIEKLIHLVDQRTRLFKPIQYILGTQPFCGLEIQTRPPVLIPRPETEEWTLTLVNKWKSILQHLPSPELHILDLCTGSGCIALGLAANLPSGRAKITGVDNSISALRLAHLNKNAQESSLKGNSVEFHKVDLFTSNVEESVNILLKLSPSHRGFDLIVSNPPYLPRNVVLDPDVTMWEDPSALHADEDGSYFHRRIIEALPFLLRKNPLLHRDSAMETKEMIPRLVMEMDPPQAEVLQKMCGQLNGSEEWSVQIWHDFRGLARAFALTSLL